MSGKILQFPTRTMPASTERAENVDLIEPQEIFTYPETDEQIDDFQERINDVNRKVSVAIAHAIDSLKLFERKRAEAQRVIAEHKKRIKQQKDPA